jgi:DNA-binding beta-propeller fold protein YncE
VDQRVSQGVEFADGSTNPTTTLPVNEAGSTKGHDLGITVALSGGLAVDSNNDLLVGDQGNSVIDIFKHGAKTPFRAIDTSPAYPYQFALDRGNKYLYVVSGTPAEVYIYDYATGALAWTVTQGLPGASGYAEGVALRPVSAP